MRIPCLLACIALSGTALAQERVVEPSPAPTTEEVDLLGTSAYFDGRLLVRFAVPTEVEQAIGRLDGERVVMLEPLIPELNLYLYEIVDGSSVLETIRALQQDPAVLYASPDHLTSERVVIPNDSTFSQQWALRNTGQSGGTVDADIDAPEAWDLGTGSADFVVAIVDGGGQTAHTDLVGNRWSNTFETGGVNGVDDDGNGYVDDRYGWNVYNNNGNIPSDGHATHVAGIVGARGNNGTGVSGVNWTTDLMYVAASGGTSTAMKGYNYVLATKNLWLSSGGTKGANVVSANSSFGIDYANCGSSSYKVWNDTYNLMGNRGILNVGATMNINANVDSTGDVPTGCGSKWLITVTNTTRSDVKNSGAAYGANTIDLGAPGTSIRSTYPTNNYTNLTGTSMAAPHVAGAVAFLHSVASADFVNYYASSPAKAAEDLKAIILDNTDFLSSLNNKTVSDGRLNLHKAALAINSYTTGPPPTFGITSVSPTSIDAVVVGGPGEVFLTGNEFYPVQQMWVDGIELLSFPPEFQVSSNTEIKFGMPQVTQSGPVLIELSDGTNTVSATIKVTVPDPPVLDVVNSNPGLLFSATGATVRMGAAPGTYFFLWVSRDQIPTLVPGIVDLDIGNGFSSLFLVTAPGIDGKAYIQMNFPFAGVPPGTMISWQGSVYDGTLPMVSTNVQSTTVLF